jgi:hypothetical protein
MAGETRLTAYKEALSRNLQCLQGTLATAWTTSIARVRQYSTRVLAWGSVGVAAARDSMKWGVAVLRQRNTILALTLKRLSQRFQDRNRAPRCWWYPASRADLRHKDVVRDPHKKDEMTALQDWAEVLKLHKTCRKSLNRHSRSGYRAVLGGLSLLVAVAAVCYPLRATGYWTSGLRVASNLMMLAAVLAMCWIVVIIKTFATKFETEYKIHRIADHPFSAKGKYLMYALFLQELVKKGWSREKITRLKRIAEALAPTSVLQGRLNQIVGGVFLLAVLANIVAEWIKKNVPEEAWKTWFPVLVIVVILMGIGLPWQMDILARLFKNSHEIDREEILGFLKLAEEDIPEKKPTQDIDLKC